MIDARADEAARSVLETFLVPPFGVPYLRLGAPRRPGAASDHFMYWWQAHLVDALIDARRRGSPVVPARLAGRLLAGVFLRNGLRFRNSYFDDMAWMSLAAQRAGARTVRLRRQLERGLSEDFGGGSFWRTDRVYKATAATGPISLFLARAGDRATAARLLDWLRNVVADEDGLFRDGVRHGDGGMEIVPHVFTYNQGPALGTMVELGDEANLDAAARHVSAIARRLTHPGTRVLITHGDGDGGLFTGILTRYLALAAADPRLGKATRATAADLVTATADNLWEGRRRRLRRGRVVTVFPQDTALGDHPHPETVELSTQLQGWLALEAAATLDR